MRPLTRFPRSFTALATLGALAALVVAGCGGAGGKNAYVKNLNKAEASLQTSLSGVTKDIGSGSVGVQMATKLEAGGKAMDAAAENFDNIDAPSDAKAANGKIVDGLHKLADLFREAGKAARANDITKVSKTLSGFETSPGAQEIQQARDDLKAAGYKVE
jgi:hypothetical protein